MHTVDLNKVSSYSSEDPAYPASNLLKSSGSHKWKCAKPGEPKAIVCFQLKSPVKIVQIDVGNEGSALVEVLVSRDADPTDTWQLSSLMSPADAKKGSDLNRVRSFQSDQLHKPACNEKWDKIRVVCSQPFSKSLQYGLSFIKFVSADEAATSGGTVHTKVGDFAIRDDDQDEIDDQKNGVGDDKKKPAAGKNGSEDSITRPGGFVLV
uniref:XRCC1_N domain-containing protein n=1 Tax=Macrostomum lignano TaxID=282301 RepID=A0A1I8HKJ5_9PLAT